MSVRRDIEPNHIVQFLGMGTVIGKLELTPAMRAQPMRLPDFPNLGGSRPDRFTHRTDRSVGRLIWWRLLSQPDELGHFLVRRSAGAGRPRLFPQQAIDTFGFAPFLPAPDAGFGLARGGRDRRCSSTIGAQKNDAAAPDMLSRRGRVRNDRIKSGRSSLARVKDIPVRISMTCTAQARKKF